MGGLIKKENPLAKDHVKQWVIHLSYLTKIRNDAITNAWVSVLTNAIVSEFSDVRYFCQRSSIFLAKKHDFFPSFKEICEGINEWASQTQAQQKESLLDKSYQNTKGFKALTTRDQTEVNEHFRNPQRKKMWVTRMKNNHPSAYKFVMDYEKAVGV